MIITWIKSKVQLIAIIILGTMLTVKTVETRNQDTELIGLRKSYSEELGRVERLTARVDSLQRDLESKPKEFITITKDVMVEMCNGKQLAAQINNLPRKIVDEKSNENRSAALDDRLPDELIRLLQ